MSTSVFKRIIPPKYRPVYEAYVNAAFGDVTRAVYDAVFGDVTEAVRFPIQQAIREERP